MTRKNKSILLIQFLLISSIAWCQMSTDSILTQEGYRKFDIQIPITYTGISPIPLVFAFHGGGSTPLQLRFQSKLHQKANTEHFIAVFPYGTEGQNGATWNAGECCDSASINNVNDVGLTSSLITHLSNTYHIDSSRIYVTGFSNGASLAYKIGCELSHKIAAIAPVSNRIIENTCAPNCGLPIIHFHALDDTIANYFGGTSPFYPTVNFPSVDSTINLWTILNNCSNGPVTTLDSNGVTSKSWNSCKDSAEIILYSLPKRGHTWADGDIADSLVRTTNIIWDFFNQHPLNCNEPTSSLNIEKEKSFTIFPNPTNENINILSSLTTFSYKVVNSLGQEMLKGQVRNEKVIDVSSLDEGLYFILLDESTSIKFVKN